jgi:hypothetical protein
LDGPKYTGSTISISKLVEKAKWVPMRLRAEERVLLKLLEGGLEVINDHCNLLLNDHLFMEKHFVILPFPIYSQQG